MNVYIMSGIAMDSAIRINSEVQDLVAKLRGLVEQADRLLLVPSATDTLRNANLMRLSEIREVRENCAAELDALLSAVATLGSRAKGFVGLAVEGTSS